MDGCHTYDCHCLLHRKGVLQIIEMPRHFLNTSLAKEVDWSGSFESLLVTWVRLAWRSPIHSSVLQKSQDYVQKNTHSTV